jgi:fermentation-respiration switch protein FrsA (DUF1100 family)/tetratricopeptide (TPR) repeat protein
VNARGLTLECSHYIPTPADDSGGDNGAQAMPAVVYLHGNGSCRVEAELLFDHTLAYGMSVFAFDFSGSGKSGGEYISLGVFEKYDVETIVGYLTSCSYVSSIALWGHSMGAATALMYSGFVAPSATASRVPPPGSGERAAGLLRPVLARGRSKRGIGPSSLNGGLSGGARRGHESGRESTATVPGALALNAPGTNFSYESKRRSVRVKALVLDSAFASFDKLASAMVQTMPLPAAVPRRLILTVGVRAVRKAVRDKAGFDVNDIDPLSACKRVNPFLPTLMLQGTNDEIVHLAHAQALREAHPGRDVELVTMEGIDHDSPRPSYAIQKAFILLQRTLFDDLGKMSIRYLDVIKVRGNDCMVQGQFKDAIFLYTDALTAVAAQERAEGSGNGEANLGRPFVQASPLALGRGDAVSGALNASDHSAALSTDAESGNHLWPESEEGDSLPRVRSAGSSSGIQNAFAKRLSSRFGFSRKPARPASGLPLNAEFGVASTQNVLSGAQGEWPPALALGTANNTSRDRTNDTLGSGGLGRRRRPRLSFAQRTSRDLPDATSADAPSQNRSRRGSFSRGAGPDPSVSTDSTPTSDSAVVEDELLRQNGVADKRKEVALALLCNRSLARLKMKQFNAALADAQLAIDLDSLWLRGYQRKAAALKSLNRIEEARLCVVDGLHLAPENGALLAMEAEFEDEALAAAMKASMIDQQRSVSNGNPCQRPNESNNIGDGQHDKKTPLRSSATS